MGQLFGKVNDEIAIERIKSFEARERGGNQMKILIACEFSGIVRDAFIKRGFDAVSCDLLPTGRPGPHIQGDVLRVLDDGWDLMVAHPPCRYLCSSGLHWNKRVKGRQAKTEQSLRFVQSLLDAPIQHIALENSIGCISTRIRPYDQRVQPWQFGHDASKATCFWLKGLPKLQVTEIIPPKSWRNVKFAYDCVECPFGCDEPFCREHKKHYCDCGCVGPTQDGYEYTERDGFQFARPMISLVDRPNKLIWGNQTPSGQNKLGPSKDRWKNRSRTYQGVADAMAAQWGDFIQDKGA